MSQAAWMQWAQSPTTCRRVNHAARPGILREGPSYFALAFTCAIHALLLGGLGRIPVSPLPRTDPAEEVLEVIWIERPEAVPTDAIRMSPDAQATRRAVARPATRNPRPQSAATTVAPMPPSSPDVAVGAPSTHAAQTPMVADDAWRPMPGAGRSRASDIDPSAFRRDPLASRDTSFDPKPAALEEAIQDRSFGGWMQAATRKRMCGDLRAALRRSPESAESIIDSMRKRGCRV